MPQCLWAVGCHIALCLWAATLPGGSGQGNCCNTMPHCLAAVGGGTLAMQRHTACGQGGFEVVQCIATLPWIWAVELLQCSATLPGPVSPLSINRHLGGHMGTGHAAIACVLRSARQGNWTSPDCLEGTPIWGCFTSHWRRRRFCTCGSRPPPPIHSRRCTHPIALRIPTFTVRSGAM